MWRVVAALLLAVAAWAKQPVYELDGRIEPPAQASVSIFGATTPFSESTTSDREGHFRFRKLLAGAYTVSIFVAGRGEARLTVDVGPKPADAKGRVMATFDLKDSDFVAGALRNQNAVSTRELSIPERARREFEEARKDLGRRDVESARAHLEKAVGIAPQFAAAWNTLGTIAYQTQKYEQAERYFRQALAQDANAYEALVNLGGVLINLHKLDEARDYNVRAVSMRPSDALANSQLGMTYFEMGRLDEAEKYLKRAVEIDPAHFSNPQLMLAEIHVKKGENEQAASDLENFLAHHPDWPGAAELRQTISKLRRVPN